MRLVVATVVALLLAACTSTTGPSTTSTSMTLTTTPQTTPERPCVGPDGVIVSGSAAYAPVSLGGVALDFMFETVGRCEGGSPGSMVADGRGLVSPPGTLYAGADVRVSALRYPGTSVIVTWYPEDGGDPIESAPVVADEGVWTTAIPDLPGAWTVHVRFAWPDGDATWARHVTLEPANP